MNKKYFYCYSIKLNKFLLGNNLKYISQGVNPNSGFRYYLYESNDQFNEVFSHYKEDYCDRKFKNNSRFVPLQVNRKELFNGNIVKRFPGIRKYTSTLMVLMDFSGINGNVIKNEDLKSIAKISNTTIPKLKEKIELFEKLGLIEGANDQDKIWCWHIPKW